MKLLFLIPSTKKVKKNVLFLLLMCVLFLSSCGEDMSLSEDKKEFFIETKSLEDFGKNHMIHKTGKISSQQSIALSSKVAGQVSKIYVQAGDKVKKWQILVSLSDTVVNYSNSLNGAGLWVESAQINYETQKLNWEKAVADTKLQLERAEKNFEISKQKIENDMLQAKINFENSDVSGSGSSSSLELQRLEESIEKAEFDYQQKLVADTQQLQAIVANAKNEYEGLLNLYTDIIDFGDSILSITDKNRHTNDAFEDYLGSGNRMALSDSKILFYQMQTEYEKLQEIQTNDISPENVLVFLGSFQDGHNILSLFLQKLEETLIDSIDSIGFPKDSFLAQINSYQQQVQWWKKQFTANYNSASSFLNTYKLAQESLQKQVQLLYTDLEITQKKLWDGGKLGEITYNKTLLSLEDQLSALKTGLENARLMHENAKKQLAITLKTVNNQIKTAQNSYSTALKEYQKLTIQSPIDGVIGSISVQEGEEISQWSPLLFVSNTSRGEIKVFFSEDEVHLLTENQEAYITLWGAKIKWKLVWVSKIANNSLNYEGSILIDESIDLVGNAINVEIPVVLQNYLIPVFVVETLWDSKWQVRTFSGGIVETKIVDLWKIWGNNIELLSGLQADDQLILSELDNFDETKYILKANTRASAEE